MPGARRYDHTSESEKGAEPAPASEPARVPAQLAARRERIRERFSQHAKLLTVAQWDAMVDGIIEELTRGGEVTPATTPEAP